MTLTPELRELVDHSCNSRGVGSGHHEVYCQYCSEILDLIHESQPRNKEFDQKCADHFVQRHPGIIASLAGKIND